MNKGIIAIIVIVVLLGAGVFYVIGISNKGDISGSVVDNGNLNSLTENIIKINNKLYLKLFV